MTAEDVWLETVHGKRHGDDDQNLSCKERTNNDHKKNNPKSDARGEDVRNAKQNQVVIMKSGKELGQETERQILDKESVKNVLNDAGSGDEIEHDATTKGMKNAKARNAGTNDEGELDTGGSQNSGQLKNKGKNQKANSTATTKKRPNLLKDNPAKSKKRAA